MTLRGRDNAEANAALEFGRAPKGAWALYRDRSLVASGDGASVSTRGPVQVEQRDGKLLVQASIRKETDLVLTWA